MNPRITKGTGITGCVRYVMGEGRDPVTKRTIKLAPGEESRVEFFGGGNFGFEIENADDIELARRVMEFEAKNQKGNARQVVVHLVLSWRPGETPTPEHMQEQVTSAMAAIGMGNARYIFSAHGDEHYRHIHVAILNINPETGKRYDLKGDQLKLSAWAQQYEAEHGGVVSVARQINNELRAAITARDAGAVLELMTRQRATFAEARLESTLAKQIKNAEQRREFAAAILNHENTVTLEDDKGGLRYSTRAVWEAEQYVRRAAENLHNDKAHGLTDRQQAKILDSERYRTMTAEQAAAFRHVTGPEGLALIDGQAGTGKSFTLAAVREAYEAAGHRVVGLGPTNAVAQDMKADGFKQASTIHSQLFALNNGRDTWTKKTVVIVDEAAMIDTKLMTMLTAHAAEAGAKLLLVGDDRQLSSIDHGGMFGALKDSYGAAALSEVKRQRKPDEARASEMMAQGNFHDALHIYDAKGAIRWTRTQYEARNALLAQWAADTAEAPDRLRFVMAVTNDDVNDLNGALRGVRKRRGELGKETKIDTAHGRFRFAVGDRLQFTGTDNKQGIANGCAGTIIAIDGTHLAVTMDSRKPQTINFDAANFDKFRHGYAGTVYKAQGRTLDQTYLYHSEGWRDAGSYVALTRHRDSTALFVATNTAKDLRELARQMSRTDERRAATMFRLYRPAEIDTPATTAAEILARLAPDMPPPREQENEPAAEAAKLAVNDRPRSSEAPKQQHQTTAQIIPMQTPQDQTQNPRFEAEQTDGIPPVTGNLAELPELDEWSPSRAFLEIADDPPAANSNRPERVALVPEAPQATTPEPQPAAAEAWRQPAFSFETIKADAWTAVYLAVPDNASPTLLNEAYNATARCMEFLDHRGSDYADAVTRGPLIDTEADNRIMAEVRRDVLQAMLYPIGAPAAEAPERERAAALEGEARAAAAEMLRPTPEPQRPETTRPEIPAEAPQTPEGEAAPTARPEAISPTGGAESAAQAENSAEALPPSYERPEAVSPLRGVRHFLERLGEEVASVFHFLQDVISPAPPPTAAQVHDRLQASAEHGNLEAQAAEAAAVAQQENAAAYDWMGHEASRAQNQRNLSFADRFGLPPTSEATRELGPAAERDLEPD